MLSGDWLGVQKAVRTSYQYYLERHASSVYSLCFQRLRRPQGCQSLAMSSQCLQLAFRSNSVVSRSRSRAGAHATHVACHTRLDTPDARATSSQHWLGWSGGLVTDALALILPIWRLASSAKALVDDILLLSPSISRYCYLWIGQPQLLSNATSGYDFHATASRLSQLVSSRSLSSDAHSMTVQSSLQLRSLDQSTTWRGIGGAVVHDALATTVPTSSSTISSNSRSRVTGPLVSALASGQSATPEWRPQGLNTAGV